MCDRIIMPDGTEIESIGTNDSYELSEMEDKENEMCLCGHTQVEILTWIVQNIPEELKFDEILKIERDPFGYSVSIAKKDAQGRVSKSINPALRCG